MRERLVVAGLFGIPMLAAMVTMAWSVGRPVSAQTTQSTERDAPLPGLVQPSDVVDLASFEKGIIEELTVDEGDMVKKGQVVCRLESNVEKASLEVSRVQAESDADVKAADLSYELAKIEFARLQDLQRMDAAGKMEFETARVKEQYAAVQADQTRRDKRVMLLQYGRDQKVLDRRTIKSPLDGYVAKKVKSVGELVDGVDDTVICQVTKLDPLHVLVPAPADTYGTIKTGDTARLESRQLPGGSAQAKVILVDRLVQADSQTFTIKLELPNPGSLIPAGIKVSVSFR
ncbi:MAG: efflux RND transporter periplasmic adaptor subunit [Phycisphaerae bacterium]|nr:efflux RND transporter periplasmic adaptor subunit [Phycisphaerae bacterium]